MIVLMTFQVDSPGTVLISTRLDILALDILGLDIMGLDILGLDILGRFRGNLANTAWYLRPLNNMFAACNMLVQGPLSFLCYSSHKCYRSCI